MVRRPGLPTPAARLAAERARTRRALAVMAGTLVLLAALFCAVAFPWRKVPPPGEVHPHPPAPHGGTLVSVSGGDRHYHAEALRERGGALEVYTLGEGAEKSEGVDLQFPTAHVRAAGVAGAAPVLLLPVPGQGDPPGKTSRFVGKLPPGLWDGPLAVTVPGVVIGGARFRLEFEAVAGARGEQAPAEAEEEERALYATPAGKYSAADVETNGAAPASRRFEAFEPAHDANPRPGDRVCPLTRTKANAACAWVVAGLEYEFCCPPCVDHFVRAAKERPGEVKGPEEYLKR